MLNLIDSINLDVNLKNELANLSDKEGSAILHLAEKCSSGNFSCLKNKSDLMRLAVVIECAENTKKFYIHKGISEKILTDTLDDIRIWCENNNNKGLKNYNWIKNHIKGELFRIGRLQYQMYCCKNKTLTYSKLPFEYGDNVLYVHIPQGEKLIYSDCVNSLKEAVSFFEKYFPEFNYRFFFSESWLLYEENWQFMDRSSNILQFSSLFDIVCSMNYDGQAIERIFGKRHLNKNNYPEKTALQKNAKAFMQSGGRLGIGIGIIDRYSLI